MNPQIMKSGFSPNPAPHGIQVSERLSRDRSTNDVWIILEPRNGFEPCQGGTTQRRQHSFTVFRLADVERPVVPIYIRPFGR